MKHSRWFYYTKLITESILAFYITTFCLAYFFTHHGSQSILLSIALVALYVFVVGTTIFRLVKRLPIAGLMLAVPIAPLLVLIIVVTMIPILENLP